MSKGYRKHAKEVDQIFLLASVAKVACTSQKINCVNDQNLANAPIVHMKK